MQPVTIRKTIEIAAPPAQVWRYIGSAGGLRAWWGVEIELEERAGGYFEERGEHEGQPYRQRGRVVTYEPPHRLAIQFEEAADSDWPTHTEISIILSGTATETTVEVIHQAFAETAAVATDAAFVAPDAVPETYGPTMMLPAHAGSVLAPTVPPMLAPSLSRPLTLQALYSWRHHHEELWQQRFGSLPAIVVQ